MIKYDAWVTKMGAVEVDLETDEDNLERGDIPKIKRTFEERRLLFLVFKGEGATQKLSHVRFWSMPKDEIEIEVMKHEKTTHYLEGKSPKKVIVVPKRIVNIVI